MITTDHQWPTALAHDVATAPAAPARARSGWRAAVRLAAAEARLVVREPAVLVGLVVFPAVTALIIAGSFGNTPDPEFGGVAPTEHYVVGYLGVVLAQLGLVSLPVHLAAYRELGVLRRYRAAGISGPTLIAGQVLLGAVLGLAACALVLGVSGAVYGIPAPADLLATVAWFVGGLACFLALGVALGLAMPSARTATAVGNLVFFPMFLLGGGGPPRQVMTAAMRGISDVLPLSHLIGGLRQSWLGTTDDPHVWWFPAALTLVAVAIALRLARRQMG